MALPLIDWERAKGRLNVFVMPLELASWQMHFSLEDCMYDHMKADLELDVLYR